MEFGKHSDANLKAAVRDFADDLQLWSGEKLKPYEIFMVETYSSEGNTYIHHGEGFDKILTDEDLRKQAEKDWVYYYYGVEDDAEERKEKIIEELIDSYIIVDTKEML